MSFKIGDIVTPKEGFIGNGYCFKIVEEILENPFSDEDSRYKLQRIEGLFNDKYGPPEYQLNKIKTVERMIWNENNLTSEIFKYNPRPYDYGKSNDFADALAYSAQVMGVPINQVNIIGDSTQEDSPTPDNPQEIRINSPGGVIINGSRITYKEKEEKDVKILDIYEERKEIERDAELEKGKEKIIAEDEIQKIILEMQSQINTILENEGRNERVDLENPNKYILTTASKEKLKELEIAHKKERNEVIKIIDEIKALFELTGDYQERVKILKRYGIINKDGKLSV